MVTNISPNQIRGALLTAQGKDQNAAATANTGKTAEATTVADIFSSRSESSEVVTYSQSLTLSGGEVDRFSMLRSLVANLLKEQGINTKIALGDAEIDLSAVTPEDARQLIAEDGYFGVEQTSERIFQFAVGIAGGDTGRIDAIREGIDRGFAEAKKAFGDWLPDISYETYDAVMKKLDDWVTQAQAGA